MENEYNNLVTFVSNKVIRLWMECGAFDWEELKT